MMQIQQPNQSLILTTAAMSSRTGNCNDQIGKLLEMCSRRMGMCRVCAYPVLNLREYITIIKSKSNLKSMHLYRTTRPLGRRFVSLRFLLELFLTQLSTLIFRFVFFCRRILAFRCRWDPNPLDAECDDECDSGSSTRNILSILSVMVSMQSMAVTADEILQMSK